MWVRLIRILSRLPLPALYLISDATHVILYDVIRFQRSLVTRNLAKAFPGQDKKTLARIARRSYRNAIYSVFETIHTLRMDKSEILHRVKINNQALLEETLSAGQSVIALTAHYGNWEWLLPAVATSLPYPVDGLYKPLRNPALTGLMVEVRSRFGSHPIPTTHASREIIKRRHIPRLLGLVADLAPAEDEEKYWTTFLDQETAFYTGPAKIAELMNAPVVFIAMRRLRRGRYEITFEPLATPPYTNTEEQVLDAFVRRLEQQIIDSPEDWLWAYPRWKNRGPDQARKEHIE